MFAKSEGVPNYPYQKKLSSCNIKGGGGYEGSLELQKSTQLMNGFSYYININIQKKS